MHNAVLPCDMLFFYEELQLLGVEIEEWKVFDGEEIETGEEKPKRLKGAAAGIGFAAPFIFF